MSERFVVGLDDVEESHVALVGGKGAHLGALTRIEGVRVPAGFCVTTDAFRRVLARSASIDDRLDELSRVSPDDPVTISRLGAQLRRTVEETIIPRAIAAQIAGAVAGLGEHGAYAVRSSATAEDSPTASFAGQQDTYLNVVGTSEVVRHVSRCWASQHCERAVTYRRRRGIDERSVQMAVVVQAMVFPRVAGILFTADPVTSNRTVACVEAAYGLGEALVSGLVNGDVYTVRDGQVVTSTVGTKHLAVSALPAGGTREEAIEARRQGLPSLTDEEAAGVVTLGRLIEAHFGCPQDIEWCLDDEGFQIVQSRPITTLFPVPERGEEHNRVYVSVGHQQMMTDAMKPLGLSFWQLTTPAPMAEAGGRLFVDVTERLATPATRAALLDALARSDPLTGDALTTVLTREGFVRPLPDQPPPGPLVEGEPRDLLEADPAVVAELVAGTTASIAALEWAIRARSGEALLDFIRADLQELRRRLFDPRSTAVFMSAMQAAWWLGEHLQEWLGEKDAADVLTQSVPGNVTSEMGLALLDVADAIRPYPDVVSFLHTVRERDAEGFLDELPALPGGDRARAAITAWLDSYGMRCVGEIDITRPRWSEQPSALVPLILSNIKNFEPGAAARRFERGRQEAKAKEQEVLERLRALTDGERKAAETKQMIDRLRTFIGYREYPKFGMVSRYFVYKKALLNEAEHLVQAGVLGEKEDVYFLRFSELQDVMRTSTVDGELIRRRREAFLSYQELRPPRVLTSDGECINGSYRRDGVPAAALAGLPVCAGVVEGRARVILDLTQARLDVGDILVTAHTDPSWTPLFVSIAGLVTEVGGLMTHGAVIAREYGLPAVVGVVDATRRIRDGQRIRVDATSGYVEVLT